MENKDADSKTRRRGCRADRRPGGRRPADVSRASPRHRSLCRDDRCDLDARSAAQAAAVETTLRLRHAWGELGQIGAGQTWSQFVDPDVFSSSVEGWAPNGMVFFRNVQLRWTPWSKGDSNFVIALERPGASADQGDYAGHIALQNMKGRFPLPDLSAHYRNAFDRGQVQLAGIAREIKWDDLNNNQFNP